MSCDAWCCPAGSDARPALRVQATIDKGKTIKMKSDVEHFSSATSRSLYVTIHSQADWGGQTILQQTYIVVSASPAGSQSRGRTLPRCMESYDSI